MTIRLGPLGLALLSLCGAASATAPGDVTKAAERCESEVADTIRRMRGKDAQEVQFVAARRVLTPATDDETSVRGEGRYRSTAGAAVPFTYSCAYNARTDAASGALFRDVGTPRPAEKSFEPDLTNLSPEACESAAAESLKTRHPRVGRIVFDTDSRRIQPGANGAVQLVGQGAVQRAAGMNATPFSYRCEVNPRNGRMLDIQTND